MSIVFAGRDIPDEASFFRWMIAMPVLREKYRAVVEVQTDVCMKECVDLLGPDAGRCVYFGPDG